MIILYWKDAPSVDDCTFNLAIHDVFALTEDLGKLYLEGRPEPIVNDTTKVGWFAVPEQLIPKPEYIEDESGGLLGLERTVGELNLNYDWSEGFIPLPGTGVPEKIEHIEDFLAKMFPTREE